MVQFYVDGNLIRGNVDTIILKCLSVGELYGNEISRVIYQASEGTYDLKKPTMYSALKRLERERLIAVRIEDSPIGGKRNYYSLTQAGRDFLVGKKFDWVFSKLLIDNLVLDKKIIDVNLEDDPAPRRAQKEEPVPVAVASATATVHETVAADKVEEFISQATAEPVAATATATAEPIITDYGFKDEDYLTVPLSKRAHQITVDVANVKQIEIATETVLLRPFVKHAGARKSGKFVLYNRLRLVCSAMVSVIIALTMAISFMFLKDPATYSNQEFNFFMVGWVCIGMYMLSNLVFFAAYPKYKQVVNNKIQGLVRRAILSTCICVIALSICVIAGLDSITASDFWVYLLVTCVIGSAFAIEGVAIHFLKRASFFLT